METEELLGRRATTTRPSSAARRCTGARASRPTIGRRASASSSRRWTRTSPIPSRDYDAPFLMPVEDVHTIAGRGTVVTGRVERGVLRIGRAVEICRSRLDARGQAASRRRHGHPDVPRGPAGGPRRRELRAAPSRRRPRRGRCAVRCSPRPASMTPRTQGEGRDVRPLREGGRPAHAVRAGLPPAVLLRHDGRDRHARRRRRGST